VQKYRVTWETDVEAETPLNAAAEAFDAIIAEWTNVRIFMKSREGEFLVDLHDDGLRVREIIYMGIRPAELAAKAKRLLAGRKYYPRNKVDGGLFFDTWCRRCEKDNGGGFGCDIADAAVIYTTEAEDFPAEWTYGTNGQPMCLAFVQSKESMAKEVLVDMPEAKEAKP